MPLPKGDHGWVPPGNPWKPEGKGASSQRLIAATRGWDLVVWKRKHQTKNGGEGGGGLVRAGPEMRSCEKVPKKDPVLGWWDGGSKVAERGERRLQRHGGLTAKGPGHAGET